MVTIENLKYRCSKSIVQEMNLFYLPIYILFYMSWSPTVCALYECGYCQPEQVHIAYGSQSNQISVSWSTLNDTQESRVQYGEGVMDKEETGMKIKFVDGGKLKREQWIHHTLLNNLKYNTTYVYHVGSQYGWSEEFWFKTPPEGEDWVVRIAIYGDLGYKNAQSLSYLQTEAQKGDYDTILHVGDFAYDMERYEGQVGDVFMRQIQPIAALVPYMTCPGNHEQAYNFSHYKHRFSMPGPFDNMFYSFDLGPIHFISISTEFYYFYSKYGSESIQTQYQWLEKDLWRATQPKTRKIRPWIIVFGHRPMYCGNKYDDCWNLNLPNRVGIKGQYALEPLLNKYGVDLLIWAHEHSYERLWPVYNLKVYNGSQEQPYVNPKAPVHIITGSAGCEEGSDPFKPNPPKWSAFRSWDYGYTRFKAYNKTHIYMEQVSIEQKGQVIDSMWLVRDRHETYNLPPIFDDY